MTGWIITAAVGVVAFIIAFHNLAQAVAWFVEKVNGLRRENRVWLVVSGIMPALGPGEVISGTKTRETSVSVHVRILNRHATNKVSLSFRLEDETKSAPRLESAFEGDVARRIMPIPGYRTLIPPVAVGPQEEVHGQVWFFFRGAPKDMPLRRFTIIDSIRGSEFSAELPEKFLETAASIEAYPADFNLQRAEKGAVGKRPKG